MHAVSLRHVEPRSECQFNKPVWVRPGACHFCVWRVFAVMSRILGKAIVANVRSRVRARWRCFSGSHNCDAVFLLGAYTDAGHVALSASDGISAATRNQILDQLAVSNFKKAGDIQMPLQHWRRETGGCRVSRQKACRAAEPRDVESARMAVSLFEIDWRRSTVLC